MSISYEETTTRRYRITEFIIKEKLGLQGDIKAMELYCGLTPSQEEDDMPHDNIIWEFITIQSCKESAKT